MLLITGSVDRELTLDQWAAYVEIMSHNQLHYVTNIPQTIFHENISFFNKVDLDFWTALNLAI